MVGKFWRVSMFACIITQLRHWIGKSEFNRLRGQLIALHIQVITQACDYFKVDVKQRQNLIHLAHDNGKKLGFLV
jgi:hypothetical protein